MAVWKIHSTRPIAEPDVREFYGFALNCDINTGKFGAIRVHGPAFGGMNVTVNVRTPPGYDGEELVGGTIRLQNHDGTAWSEFDADSAVPIEPAADAERVNELVRTVPHDFLFDNYRKVMALPLTPESIEHVERACAEPTEWWNKWYHPWKVQKEDDVNPFVAVVLPRSLETMNAQLHLVSLESKEKEPIESPVLPQNYDGLRSFEDEDGTTYAPLPLRDVSYAYFKLIGDHRAELEASRDPSNRGRVRSLARLAAESMRRRALSGFE